MAPSADPVPPQALPTSPKATTAAADSPVSRLSVEQSTLSTIPSDEDRSSEDGLHWSGASGRARSDSSSISEPAHDDGPHVTPDEDSNGDGQHGGETIGHGTPPGAAVQASKPRSASGASMKKTLSHDNVQRLSAAEMQNLTSSPESLPVAPAPQRRSLDQDYVSRHSDQRDAIRQSMLQHPDLRPPEAVQLNGEGFDGGVWQARDPLRRSLTSPRNLSTPPSSRAYQQASEWPTSSTSPRRFSIQPSARPPPLHLNLDGIHNGSHSGGLPTPVIQLSSTTATPAPPDALGIPSPVPQLIPLPPTSLPTHLQLELAAGRPSPLYIHQSHINETPYESSAIKFERLKNVLFLPPFLERTLYFGALACLDAWLYTFTILPIRFVMALSVLVKWWAYVLAKEVRWMINYVWYGLGRLWRRGRTGRSRSTSDVSDVMRSRSRSAASEASADVDAAGAAAHRRPNRGIDARVNSTHLKATLQGRDPGPRTGSFRHRRTKSMPSSLSTFHKADLLQGAVILCSSAALMTLDASRMYHFIRAQSAIKLYVIYNILEVGDRLLSALGQDILECLFSTETLSRNSLGRSKILLPLGMFLLALAYNCLHSITLYYQVITLNVAVNSYSNALLTLLLSNQFVEIKSTVFKRIEKDNLFQLTCADIVERFHLWIMLLIIGMRNIVEVGGLSVPGAGSDSLSDESSSPGGLHNPSILPHSFTVLPSWLMSGEVLSPFFIVVGSEMLVDTIKHAYVTKFNNIKPNFYSRILDILCKDYYTNAFSTPSLTRRLGLAVIPLSCLFIRASIQTYHMFLSTHLPMPIPPSTQTSLTEESAVPSSPAMIAALNRFDSLLRDSLGRATYGYPYGSPLNSRPWYAWNSDDFIAALTMIVFFFITFLVLLMAKLLLGMVLLSYSRNRYAKMKQKEVLIAQGKAERESYDANGRRAGGRGEVEIGDDRQRWIHADKTEGLKGGKGPGGKRLDGDDKKNKPDGEYVGVDRYEMVAKRIW